MKNDGAISKIGVKERRKIVYNYANIDGIELQMSKLKVPFKGRPDLVVADGS